MKVSFYFPPGRLRFEVDLDKDRPVFDTQRHIAGGGPLEKTKHSLEEKGVNTELFNQWNPNDNFDIFYVDGSKYELLNTVKSIKMINKPVVMVTAAYSSSPLWQFKIWSYIENILPIPTVYGLRQKIYGISDLLIPKSESEKKQLLKSFSIDEKKVKVVHGGVSRNLFSNPDPSTFRKNFGISNFVLQVGRINMRKGQTRLIKALEGVNTNLVFVGELDGNDPEGVNKFRDMVEDRSWVHYIGPLPHGELLASAYAAARVHALPSRYEFPGKVTLESAATGCATVSGPYPPIKDYLGERIYYCDPEDIDSIRHSVKRALQNGPQEKTSDFVLENYSWEKRAEKLIRAFHNI